MHRPTVRTGLVAAAMAVTGLLAAGCGSSTTTVVQDHTATVTVTAPAATSTTTSSASGYTDTQATTATATGGTSPVTSTTTVGPGSSAGQGSDTLTTNYGPNASVTFAGAAGSPRAKPPTLFLSADGTLEVDKVTWSSWGQGVAAGSGTASYHGCNPNCATAPQHSAPVRIELSDITECQQGKLYYNSVKLIEANGSALDASYLGPENWAPCRSNG